MNEQKNKQPEHGHAGPNGHGQSVNDEDSAAVQETESRSGEQGNGTATHADGDDELARLQAELAEAQAELDRHREAMLRMQAETENQRKRMVREMDKSRRFALERMMKDLLQVRDSLERGLDMDEESATVEALREGGALTLRLLSKVMQDHGLEVIDPQGQSFDPEWHEAMTMAPTADHEENTVIEVLQKGFKLNDRLIRPAMVVVSRKPDQ